MDKWVLVAFNGNWADEFDLYGFKIMTKERWSEMYFCAQHCLQYPKSLGFGTNQEIEFEHWPSWIQSLTVREITYAEVLFFKRMFPKELAAEYHSYGPWPDIVDGNMEDEFYQEDGGFVGVVEAEKIWQAFPQEKRSKMRNG